MSPRISYSRELQRREAAILARGADRITPVISPEVGWRSVQGITVQQISCGAGHRFSWPAELEHGAQTTNDDRLRHARRFATLADAVESFLATREQTVRFVEACDEDLRARPMTHPLLGPINCHEALLSIAVHPRRHAAQVREIGATLAGSGGQQVGYPEGRAGRGPPTQERYAS